MIARHKRHDSEMDGLILGAAVGMGFAALESNGYAFTAFLESNGSISTTVGVTLIRGLLSPLGHGTWTAILASVLFRESRNGHFRIDLQVIGAYLARFHPALIVGRVNSGRYFRLWPGVRCVHCRGCNRYYWIVCPLGALARSGQVTNCYATRNRGYLAQDI